MKTTLLSLAMLVATGANAQSNFTLIGAIPGTPAGVKVSLVAKDSHERDLGETTTKADGSFEINGKTSRIQVAELRIMEPAQKDDYDKDRGMRLMVEPGTTMTISAAHFDSIPYNYYYDSTPLFKEPNVVVTGGTAQSQYNEWRRYIHDAELAAWQADFELRDVEFGIVNPEKKKLPAEQKAAIKAEALRQEAVVDSMNRVFMRQHPDYAISLVLQNQALEPLFAFTAEEYQEIIDRYKDNYDQTGYQRMKQLVEGRMSRVQGTQYKDFPLVMADNSQKRYSDLIEKGKWNFVDFWASWCGPCRAAIPHVKEMQKTFGDQLNIISVSLDKDDNAWRKAMEQEQMPWTQAKAPMTDGETKQAINDFYEIHAIPYLMVIDPEGRVVFTTHDPDAGEAFVKSRM